MSAAEYVVVVTLPGTMEHFTKRASGRLTVGRTDDCDICLAYPTVSRPHAEIDCAEDGRFVVRDLNSRNGTTVNGQTIRNAELAVAGKATVQIGPYVLTLAASEDLEDTVTVNPTETVSRLKLDRGMRALVYGENVVVERMSALEYRLIECLDSQAPNVVENAAIGDRLWGAGQWDVYMLHNLVRRLRRKLEEANLDADAHLVTVPGVGYRLA